jgi:hypothetical protein
MAALWTHILLPFRNQRFWVLAGIVFAGRMAWFAYWGVLLEIDSLGYLELQANLSHPPLYSLLNAILLRLVGSLEVVVVGQSLLYGLAASFFLSRFAGMSRSVYALAVALALEPLSGKLACTVMAETLFLSLLLLALGGLPGLLSQARRHWGMAALAVGLLLGLAYLTRYAAPVFGMAWLLWLCWQRLPVKRILLSGVLLVIGFQAAILPLRLYYQVNFGTLEFNGFSGLSIWNTAAYLYPDAEIAPQNDFERYLETMPIAKFALDETWHTNQIFHADCAYARYVQYLGTADKLAAGRAAGRLGWRLLAGAPVRHLRDFVWPNVQRPFSKKDTIYADLLPPLIPYALHYQPYQLHVYSPVGWWIAFALLLGTTVAYVARRKTAPPIVGALLLSCWLYLAGIALLTVVFLRFVYLLGPLIVLAAGLLWTHRPQSSSN